MEDSDYFNLFIGCGLIIIHAMFILASHSTSQKYLRKEICFPTLPSETSVLIIRRGYADDTCTNDLCLKGSLFANSWFPNRCYHLGSGWTWGQRHLRIGSTLLKTSNLSCQLSCYRMQIILIHRTSELATDKV